MLPLNPDDPQEADQQAEPAAPGPELSNQGSAPQVNLAEVPPAAGGDAESSRQGTPIPEGFELTVGVEAGSGTASAPAAGAGSPTANDGGVEETKGADVGDLEGGSLPETREEAGTGPPVEGGGADVAESTSRESWSRIEEGGREEGGNGVIGVNGGVFPSPRDEEAKNSEAFAHGVVGGTADPESTRLEESTRPRENEPLREGGRQEEERGPYVNGGGGELPQSLAAAGGGAAAGAGKEMDASPGVDGGGAAAAAAAAAVPAAAPAHAPATTAVTEPHLKTAGQPLTHGNRAESPTGMSTDLQDKLKALKLRRKHRFVTMRIEGTEVVAETLGAPKEGPAELKVALPYSDCRYAVYDQEIVTADGRKANKLFFFTWLPHNATPHNKVSLRSLPDKFWRVVAVLLL